LRQALTLEIKRVLKPDGILIISTPNTGAHDEKPDHHNQFQVKGFQKAAFRTFLQEQFTHTYHFEQGFEIVSLAANKEILNTESLSSAFQADKDFREMLSHIKSLQKEQQPQTQAESPAQMAEKIAEKEKTIHSLSIEKEKQAQTVQQVTASLVDKENIITELNHKISTLYQQVDQLNNRLSEIYSSEGWKQDCYKDRNPYSRRARE
jgi:hypothetical protein